MASSAIRVLDHGLVRLVSYMQPNDTHDIEHDDGWTGDLEIVRNARVSYNAVIRTGEDAGKDEKLVRYLHNNRHTSPFEAMVFTFEIKSPIFVIRQWHRHRTWAYSEVSARYTELPEEFYIPQPQHIGRQSKSNKQVRDLAAVANVTLQDLDFIADLQVHSVAGFELYRKHLEAGVPRELARLFLGLNTYSHFFGTVNLHNLFHFLRLRLHSHAQYEIRAYAMPILQLIQPIVPWAVSAFEDSL